MMLADTYTEQGKHNAAVALARSRWAETSPEERSEHGRQMALARWHKPEVEAEPLLEAQRHYEAGE